jgi:protein-S-isoprenylcysteine O-methyltransferase Ste14
MSSPKPAGRLPEPVLAAMLLAVALAVLFGSAGTAKWLRGWAFAAVTFAGLWLHRAHAVRHNPAAVARRNRIGPGTKGWDRVWLALYWPMMLAIPLTAGLGARFGWPGLPRWTWPAGVLGYALGMTISARAMAANPFFEGTARIQTDQGHRVVDAGPYRRVRHPGYAGLALWALSMPLLLGSTAAFAPAALVAIWVAARTALEDRMLREELPGYADYASRVRFRLVPGVW